MTAMGVEEEEEKEQGGREEKRTSRKTRRHIGTRSLYSLYESVFSHVHQSQVQRVKPVDLLYCRQYSVLYKLSVVQNDQ